MTLTNTNAPLGYQRAIFLWIGGAGFLAKISRSYTISGMERLIAVAIGGAVGALLRYGIALWAGVSWQTAAGRFPIGTFGGHLQNVRYACR